LEVSCFLAEAGGFITEGCVENFKGVAAIFSYSLHF